MSVKYYPKAMFYGDRITGGLILGAWLSQAGVCTGTVFAQIGADYKDS